MFMNDSEFEAGLKQFVDPAGIYHEDFKQNFAHKPELREKLDSLFKSRWPEPPSGPPPNPAPPQPGGTLGKGPGEIVDPRATSGENIGAEERRVAEQHLIQTLGASEAGSTVAAAREVFGSLVDRNNAGDQAFLTLFEGAGLGNDPELVVRLSQLRGKLPALGPSLDRVAMARMSPDEKLGRAISAVTAILGPLNSPFVRRLERLFPDQQSQSEILDFLASKNFR
jgi:hypothetical protein